MMSTEKHSAAVSDEQYMRRCLQIAANGLMGARPNPMVGAVIVSSADGSERIIGEGYHVRYGEGHAEVNAFASVAAADEPLLSEATLYVSLEPCSHYGKTPPCAELIVRKGVRRVVVGCVDPFAQVQGRGIAMLRQAGIEVTVGILEDECRWLNRRFFTYHSEHRPYIILKWASSADGFLDDHFQPVTFSTPFTQMLSHKLRAEEDAILVGRVTYERDRPALTVRHWSGDSPKRVVLTHDRPLPRLMDDLYMQGVQSLIVEGGALTHRSFLDAGLYDEVRVETSPIVVGDGTAAPQLPADVVELERVGDGANVVVVYRRLR